MNKTDTFRKIYQIQCSINKNRENNSNDIKIYMK